mgnify:CR=1 FL=1
MRLMSAISSPASRALAKPIDDSPVNRSRRLADDAEAEFVVDDPVHMVSVFFVWDDDLDGVAGFQPASIEVIFHCKSRTQEPDTTDSGLFNRVSGRVCYMQQRDGYGRLDGGSNLVHRVGAQHQEVRAGRCERPRGAGEIGTGFVPTAGMLKPFDVMKVHAVKNNLRRMKAAETLLNEFIDMPVVRHGGFPAHSADQADGLQVLGRHRERDGVADRAVPHPQLAARRRRRRRGEA